MVTNKETTVKLSRWLLEEVDKFINKNMKNASDFPSKRNFVDRAIIKLLEEQGVDLR
jgi:metal-responsive CopG/Arc/MetJ family transcriptional regulator